ncbi:MAG: hypothetical protein V1862_14385 [Methanobacteriota archaeon]
MTDLDLIGNTGLDISDAYVPDFGAGTGSLAIPLVIKGAHVPAVDFSEGILKKLSGQRQSLMTMFH